MRKKQKNRILAGFLTAAVLMAGSVETLASQISLSDQKKLEGVQSSDLFSNMKNLMPGDQMANTISITNRSKQNVVFYLKAYTDYVAKGNGAVKNEDVNGEVVKQEGKVFHESLLDVIEMTIYSQDQIVYQGSASGKDSQGNNTELVDSEYGISLGTIGAGDTGRLKIELLLPGEKMTNEYMNAFGAIHWTFIAEGKDPSSPSGGGGGTDSSPGTDGGRGPGYEINTIPEDQVPLGGWPTAADGADGSVSIVIDDNDIPLAALAKTGGPSLYFTQLLALFAILCTGLILVEWVKRRKG